MIKRIGRRARLFDPDRAENRKFLALRIAGADRQAARGDAELWPRAFERKKLAP